MSMNLSEAKAAIQNATSIDDIIDAIERTSARVQGAPAGAVSVLYNGSVDGRASYDIARSLASARPDHVIVDRTPVGPVARVLLMKLASSPRVLDVLRY